MKLYLIDLSSFIFRAYYAVPPLHSPKGEPLNAVYGVANMLLKFFEKAQPTHLAVVKDVVEGSVFRKTLYPAYKAHRSAPPEDLIPQFEKIDQLIQALGVPVFSFPGKEADDGLAALTQFWCQQDLQHEVVLVTGDKDFMQLVSPRVKVWDTLKNAFFDEAAVLKKWGVAPTQMQDYLALVGDASDGIPGIPSVGPKTAVQWLQTYQHWEGLWQAVREGKLPAKKTAHLLQHESLGQLSRTLVGFEPVDLGNLHPDQLAFQPGIQPAVCKLFEAWRFDSLLKRQDSADRKKASLSPILPLEEALGRPSLDPVFLQPDRFRCLSTLQDLEVLVQRLRVKGYFAFDLETTSLDPLEAEVVGCSLCEDPEFAVYIPMGHRDPFSGQRVPGQLSSAEIWQKLRPLLEDPTCEKWGQNVKYDMSVLKAMGFDPQGFSFDTLLAAYLIHPEGKHSLGVLADKYLGYSLFSFEAACQEAIHQKGASACFADVSLPLATRYAAEDAWLVVQLKAVLEPQLRAIPDAWALFQDLEMPFVSFLCDLELQGVAVDRSWFTHLHKQYAQELSALEHTIQGYAKVPFNLNSPKQLSQFLFEELGLPPQAKTATHTGYSTDADVLFALREAHPVVPALISYRELSKLQSTYVEAIPERIHPKTGRVHASFHQTGTATGRLSSSHPNLQNIPIRTQRGFQIRRGFVASVGHCFVSADYSQIELRILAHLSEDPCLMHAFLEGEDVHRLTASELFSIALEQVDLHQRRIAKAINFGLMYGKSAFGLAQELHLSRAEAQQLLERYFLRYAGVKVFFEAQIQKAREQAWVETLWGRRRPLEGIRSRHAGVRAQAERIARNTPIQGTAADLMKKGLLRLRQFLKEKGLQAAPVIQIHDEILIDCPLAEEASLRSVLTEALEGAATLKVPLIVHFQRGPHWMFGEGAD